MAGQDKSGGGSTYPPAPPQVKVSLAKPTTEPLRKVQAEPTPRK